MKTVLLLSAFFLLSLSSTTYTTDFQELKSQGTASFSEKKFSQAATWYKKALPHAQTNKDRAIIHFNLGQCQRQKKDIVGALTQFDLALTYDPVYEKPLIGMTQILADRKLNIDRVTMPGDLAAHLGNAIHHDPSNKRFREMLATFEMQKTHTWVAPEVSYVPDFLTDQEVETLTRILDQSTWKKEFGCYAQCDFTPFRAEFDSVWNNIIQRLKSYQLFLPNVSKYGYIVIRYDEGGWLPNHKDLESRSNHFVLGLSIGGPCSFDFVRDQDQAKTSIKLASKSVYVTQDAFHDVCTHGISHVDSRRYAIVLYVPAPDDWTEQFDISTMKFFMPEFERDGIIYQYYIPEEPNS